MHNLPKHLPIHDEKYTAVTKRFPIVSNTQISSEQYPVPAGTTDTTVPKMDDMNGHDSNKLITLHGDVTSMTSHPVQM